MNKILTPLLSIGVLLIATSAYAERPSPCKTQPLTATNQVDAAVLRSQGTDNTVSSQQRAPALILFCKTNPDQCEAALVPLEERPSDINDPCQEHRVTAYGTLASVIATPAEGTAPQEFFELVVHDEKGMYTQPIAVHSKIKQHIEENIGNKVTIYEADEVGEDLLLTPESNIVADELDHVDGWWADGLFAKPNTPSLGETTKILLVRIQASDSFAEISPEQFEIDIRDTLQQYLETVSDAKFLPTVVTLSPTIVLPNAAACHPFTAWQQAQPFLEAVGINLHEYAYIHFVSTYLNCGWCGINYLGAVEVEPTWFISLGQTRESCTIGGRKTIAHEVGHGLGLHHGASWAPTGVTIAREDTWFTPEEALVGRWTEYNNVRNVMGNTNTGGHFGPLHKAILEWLTPESDFLYNPTPGTYTIRPVSATSGLRGLIFRRALKNVTVLEFRQPTDWVEEHTLITKENTDGNWDECLYMLTSQGGNFAHESTRLNYGQSPIKPACIQAGKDITDPATGLSFHVDSISAAGAIVTIFETGTPDFGIPQIEIVSPTNESTVSGVVPVHFRVQDPEGQLGGWYSAANSISGDPYSRGLAWGPISGAPGEWVDIHYDWDTTEFGNLNSRVRFWGQVTDAAWNTRAPSIVLNVVNTGPTTTTSSTSTSSTSTSSTSTSSTSTSTPPTTIPPSTTSTSSSSTTSIPTTTTTSSSTTTIQELADVFIITLRIVSNINTSKRTTTRKAVIYSDGTLKTQRAVIGLIGKSENGIAIANPNLYSSIDNVGPFDGESTKTEFNVGVTCVGEGRDVITWEAIIEASENSSGTNDSIISTTNVRCR